MSGESPYGGRKYMLLERGFPVGVVNDKNPPMGAET